MTNFTRGQKGKLADLGLNGPFAVTLDIVSGSMEVDVSCFGVDAGGKLSDDRYMVFYNQKSSPDNAVTVALNGPRSVFQIDLARLPTSIDKLVFTAATEQGSMRALGASSLALGSNASFAFAGQDFQDEKAVIIGELYRRDGSWRFGAVGQGFAGGLAALLKHFGGSEASQATPAPAPASIPAPAPAAPPANKISLSKIRLEKRGDKISLDKRDNGAYGRIRVNLNWNQNTPQNQASSASQGTGFLGKLFAKPAEAAGGIDLDIGCLFEMTNGAKSAVQALGNSWGAFDRPPYIHLEGDDRTGSASDGENIFINGTHFDQIKRVLVYAFIYEGVPNWAATDGVVTIDVPGQPTVEVRLDSHSPHAMCAIAMLENHGGNLQVTKLVEYFGGQGKITAHQAMDERYQFGLNWKAGRKD
ncbi:MULTISPECIES: TerD family protein [unclassified Janthinobacterium]|uniref:TerD family protein n=1 Tax=unclassified Janthinobacterium TaxID=2610881 RepID=UPI00160F64B4|nr:MULTISPECIES: TerD family protein [unclassified Janthinobacterium]MBB5608972.1 tellurite resistance protein TerA [Janthinobacterium sp. S3T4]MBB5614297.1 tellurite resistance protein TerA [Janthinobacterium sp. S3M3]